MKKLLSIVSLLLLTISLNAQEVCGFDSVLTIQKNSNPEFINQINQVNEALNYYIESKKNNQSILSISNTAEYVIPVVVHIVRDPSDAISVISYAQIESQIDALNAAFSKGYPTYNGNSNGPNAVDTKIQFCLAKNPTGPTNWTNSVEPGVMRYDDALRSHNQMTIASTDDLLSLTHPVGWFPFSKYLNIWVVQSIDGLCASSQTQGYSVLPLLPQVGINGFTIDGVVIRGDAFGDNSTGNSFTLQPHNSYGSCVSAFAVTNQGKVLVHEIGHYLNLYHTFQNDIITGATCAGNTPATCINEGDYICDTPPAILGSTYVCGQSIPSSCGIPEMVENFMAYSQDPCKNTFTQNQTERITAYLDLFRPELSSLDNQIYTGIRGTGGCIPPELIASFSFTGNNCINTPITFNSVAAPANSATTFSWSSTGGTIGSPTSANTTITFTTPGSYTVTLSVNDGSGPIYSNQIIGVSACQLNPDYIHNAQWYYGQYASVDFTSGAPVPTNTARVNETIFAMEGAYSYSDDNGNLVFYTDGINLWNNLHQQINTSQIFSTAAQSLNTITGINEPAISVHGLTGVPFPNHPNEYFLFSAPSSEDLTSTSGFVRWVHVNLNTGIITPTQNLTPNGIRMAECLTIIPHCNGQDYWVMSHTLGTSNNRFYTYLLSTLGLNLSSNISVSYIYRVGLASEMKGSPDNTRIVLAGGIAGNATTSDIAIYSFDNLTGNISNEQIFDAPGESDFLGCSFSPNSLQIYATSWVPRHVVQFDVLTGMGTIITAAPVTVQYLQLGPDDNIYIGRSGSAGNFFTGQVVNPNIPANIGSYNPTIIDFSTILPIGIRVKNSLPNFMDGIQPDFSPADFTFTYTSCSEVNFTLDACWSAYDAAWNFGDATPVVSGDNVNHTYSSPGTYTVTCSLTLPGLAGSIDVQHQVTILNTNTNITGPSSVCLNDQNPSTYSVPFISGSVYNWTVSGNGTIVSPNGGSQINIGWSSGSTGTVSVSITSGGCFSSGVLNITINPQPVVTAIANPTTVCPPGSPVTLTAFGASSYLWVFGSSTVSGNPITDNPIATTSYTVVGTDNNGCQASTIISVTVNAICTPTDCNLLPTTTLPIGATSTAFPSLSGVVDVLGLFTIDNPITYTNVKFRMAAGAQIDIASGSSLTLQGCHVFSCTQLWKEITVNPNANLVVQNFTIIEDAEKAIHWSNGGSVNISNSIFNRNGVGLHLEGAATAPNVLVRNTIFTCRNFPNSLYSTLNATSFLTLKNNLYNNNLSLYPYGSLIAPAPANTRSLYGVLSTQVAATIGITGNPKNRNLFDYLDFGIRVTNANFTVINNSFANLSGYDGSTVAQQGNLIGIGVYANAQTGFTINIGGTNILNRNQFKNCYRGANITNYWNINFINNTITNTTTSATFAPPTYNIGHYGLAIFLVKQPISTVLNYNINSNSIDNNETGIYINGVYSLIQNNFIQITSNQMDVTGTGTYCNRGLWIQNMVGSQAVNGDVFVSGNTIENCEINAMLFENVNDMLRVDGNVPSVVPTPTLQTKEVVRLNSCTNASVVNNTISTTNNTTIPSGTTTNFITGIFVNKCQSSLVSCNTILYVDVCVAFIQSNSMSQFTANDMNYAQYGLVLANGGIIGQQGDATHPSGNRWGRNDANNITLNHTYVFATTNANSASPLYCKPNPTSCSSGSLFKTFPCSNGFATFGQGYELAPLGGLFTASGPSSACNLKPGNPKANALALLQEATNGNGSNVDKFLHKSQAFHLIKTDQTGVLLNDPTLSTFYQQEQVQNIGKLSTTKELVVANDYLMAKNTVNSVAPTNVAESNFKIAYDVWLDLLLDSNYVLNTTDSTQLVTVANMCLQEGGDATIMARTLLASFTQNAVNYVDCFELPFGDTANRISETSSFDEKMIESFGFSQEVKVNLYPNPNNGSFRVTHNLPLENNVYIEVMDITGKIVHREILTTGSQQVVKTQQLNTGLYFVNFISDSGELMYSTKMSILHE